MRIYAFSTASPSAAAALALPASGPQAEKASTSPAPANPASLTNSRRPISGASFGVIASNGGYATVTELSGGIYKSLLTTAAGLVVATPTFVAYSYLSSRVNTLMHDMERAGIEIVQMLTETEPESGIISFQPSAENSPRDLRREK